MRTFLIPAVIILSSLHLSAQDKHTDTLARELYVAYELKDSLKEGQYTMTYKGKLLTRGNYSKGLKNGHWDYVGFNDTLQQEGDYLDGMRQGTWKSYYSDGTLSCTMPFLNGHKEGIMTGYFPNTAKAFEANYVNDLIEGEYVHYYQNGKKYYTSTYQHDTLNGIRKTFYEDGTLEEEAFMKGSKRDSIYSKFYPDGKVWEKILYRQGKEFTVIEYNDKNGNPKEGSTLKNGNGVVVFYDLDERPKLEMTYKNGVENGWCRRYEKGKLREEGNYLNGMKDSIWKTYSPATGEVVSVITFKEGKEEGTAVFYQKYGEEKGNFVKGKREGLWTRSDKEGGMSSEINYQNGMFEGAAKYYTDGKLSEQGDYSRGRRVFVWKTFDKKGNVISSFDYGYVIPEAKKDSPPDPPPLIKEDSDVLVIVEKMPAFPGGESMMMDFIVKNIKYPRDAREMSLSGTVYVTFVVNSVGEIENVRILRGVHKWLDEEAMRVVRSMPRWAPGMQSGKPVSVQFNLPIKYKLK